MVDRPLVATKASLDAYLTALSPGANPLSLEIPDEARDSVTSIMTESAVFLIHVSDGPDVARVVFTKTSCLDQLPGDAPTVTTAFQRATRLALSAGAPPVRLNPAWSEYHRGNLIAFFAVTREMGALRWVAQLGPHGTDDVFFCRLTSPSEAVLLQDFSPPIGEYRRAIRHWDDALEQSQKRFAHRSRTVTVGVVETVDLEATTFGAVVGSHTYSGWLEHLTPEQLTFLERPPDVSTKLRGPAGSGKTLLLELKALHESYGANGADRRPRILFVTHSWAVADQVDAALTRLHDQSTPIDGITVFPLLAIAQDLLPAERQGRGFDLLGEDNLSGKIHQLEAIDGILDDTLASDWLAFEDRCSAEFVARVTAPKDSPDRRAFVWDLMNEFACVLSAHGILPGFNAERNYLPLRRMPWMMPLVTDGEKLFVLHVYSALVGRLREAQLLTSDQLINDFLNYLETFAWNLRRTEAGYDLIFVDELHLFSEQERLALSFLSRDADSHPVMFMALDPRQSPAEAYTGSAVAAVSGGDSGEADAVLGEVDALDLRTVHRFSPEILELVRHINNGYPALDLSGDWALDADRLETSVAATGQRPLLATHADRASEVAGVIADAEAQLSSRGPDERVAITLVDSLALAHYRDAAIKGGSIRILEGRDDVESLQYSKRAVVLSPAEYVAGLQFNSVIVAGFPEAADRRANLGHERRRLLSLLYLAVSRATSSVSIHVNMADGGVPDVLASAVEREIVEVPGD